MNLFGHPVTASSFSLKALVNKLENSVITLSGPAIAISGIIAGIDLLTGGSMFKSEAWLSLTWAICLLLTLDFNVLSLGSKAKRVYRDSAKKGWQKFWEIVLIMLIAAAISSVSVQMQSIIARSQSTVTYTDRTGQHTRNLTIDEASQQMGINPIWLIWERSALVLILIFMSGWLRDENDSTKGQSQEPTTIDYQQVAQAIMPLLAPYLNGLKATIVAEIKPLIPAPGLAPEPLDYQKLAQQMAPLMAPAIQPEPLDYQEIARTIAPLVAPETLNYQELATHITPLLPEPEPVPALDYQELARIIAPLIEARATKSGTEATSRSQNQGPEPDSAETTEQRDERLEAAYQELRAANKGKRVSGRQLAERARANRGYCTKWLQDHHPINQDRATDEAEEMDSEPTYQGNGAIKTDTETGSENSTEATSRSYQDTEELSAYVAPKPELTEIGAGV